MTVAQQKADDWFVTTVARPHAALTIIAFPQCGGGCASFSRHARLLPDWLSLATLNLPGRQARFGEPFCTDIDELTPKLAQWCAGLEGPFAFLGYCSGALLAYCVARLLRDQHAPLPRRLIVGSFRPPHAASVPPLAGLTSDRLWQVLTDHQAVVPELAANAELRKLSEPVLRADFTLVGGYRHTTAPPLPVPVTVLRGERDSYLTDDDAAGWGAYTDAGLAVRRLPGGHWFMEEAPTESAAALAELATDDRPQPAPIDDRV